MPTKQFWIGSLLLGMAGCTPFMGLSPRETLMNDYSLLVYTGLPLPDTGSAIAAPEPIHAGPLRLGVIQAGEVAPPTALLDKLRSRPDLVRLAEPLPGIYDGSDEASPLLIKVAPDTRPAADVEKETRTRNLRHAVDRMRALAGEMGLDYLVLYGGTIDASTDDTPLAVFDLTIVGLFIVPSQEVRAEANGAAAMIDVRTGRVVLTVSAQAKKWSLTPDIGVKGGVERMITAVRDDVSNRLARQLIARLDSRSPGPPASK